MIDFNTGEVDIRIVREWLKLKDYPSDGICDMPLITGFDDEGVYLTCLDCRSKTYIGINTYNIMTAEVKND